MAAKPESDYVQRVLGEPLRDALSAVVLYQPTDPIFFLAHYLRYWVEKVRNYRRRKAAVIEMERLLSMQIPWNVGVVAETAKRLEQLDLDAARVQAEEDARLRAIERARVNKLTAEKAEEATARLRVEANAMVMEEITDMGVELAFKKWVQMEKARIKAEKAAKRRAAEEAGEEVPEEGEEDEG